MSTKRKATDQDVQDSADHGRNVTVRAPKRKRIATARSDLSDTEKQEQPSEPTLKPKPRPNKKKLPPPASSVPPSPFHKLMRPWLSRPQPLSAQLLFLISCRDNLVTGATGAKPWDQVAREFNERFKDELKQPLAGTTLSKRAGQARKVFLSENPEYTEALKYPVPEFEEEEDGGDGDGKVVEEEKDEEEHMDVEMREGELGEEEGPRTEVDSAAEDVANLPQTTLRSDSDERVPSQTSGDVTSVPNTHVQSTSHHPGAYYPSLIPPHNICPISRASYHLRRRTTNPVAFLFLDDHEASLDSSNPHTIDHALLLNLSPLYRQLSASDPDFDAILPIPKPFSHKTLNIFLQIIAPCAAHDLPTHYLWRLQDPVPGVYDRFGAILPEKITWSVDMLIELHLFAQYVQVHWISDMVIDRLHWMFLQQKAAKDASAHMRLNNARRDEQGRRVFIPPKLFGPRDARVWGLSVQDFDEVYLNALVQAGVEDEKVLVFIADLMRALGGRPGKKWLEDAPEYVQDIFADAQDAEEMSAMSREKFCARYHSHDGPAGCYTAALMMSGKQVVDALYTFASQEELVKYSDQLKPATAREVLEVGGLGGSLRGIKGKHLTPEKIEAEKKIWEMEIRAEEARTSLFKSR
ncbi:hypothetical protein FB567DRAFT_597988 [Paraphoma chrysanthemicola]|uniref:Uncharacterized protein n=1 Tax=Paraphoma chrysanthemicola TaxID=798071 RepID=A0A8K0QWB7_9PLEO|nr:hypothetical protein FB567DRAFT_597988 [Paraphoma chrysanthemicola]